MNKTTSLCAKCKQQKRYGYTVFCYSCYVELWKSCFEMENDKIRQTNKETLDNLVTIEQVEKELKFQNGSKIMTINQ